MNDQPIADDETAQCWRNDPHQPHTWTWRPEDGGADCPGIATPAPAEARTEGGDPLADPWLHPINAGAVHLEPERPIRCGPPLTGVRMDPDDVTQGEPNGLRDQIAAAIGRELGPGKGRDGGLFGAIPRIADAVLAVRDAELQQLREELEDVRHNLAARAFTSPDADFETILASLDARIRDALNQQQDPS